MEIRYFNFEAEKYSALLEKEINIMQFLESIFQFKKSPEKTENAAHLAKTLQIYHEGHGTVPEIADLTLSTAELQSDAAGILKLSYTLNLYYACAGDAFNSKFQESIRFEITTDKNQLKLYFPIPVERSSHEEF